MIITTTESINGYNIVEYKGIVSGTDIYLVGGLLGGGLANQENLYANAIIRETKNLKNNAIAMGANGVVGIQNILVSPGNLNSIIVVVTGTAVKIEKVK